MKTFRTLALLFTFLLAILACNLPLPDESAPQEIIPNEPPIQQLEATVIPSATVDVQAEAVVIPSSTPEVTEIVLVGYQSLALGEAATYIQNQSGYVVRVNEAVTSAELMLFTINAADGPMPETIRQIQNQAGQTVGRAAILLINTDLQPDAELEQLVLLETREILSRFIGEERANRLEVLRMPDAEIANKLQSLLILPPVDIFINSQ